MASRAPRSPDREVLQIFIFREGRFWGTECFAQQQISMGRSPEVDLQLDDDLTSRNHAAVSVSAEGLILEDLGSSNGTYVNGEPIERCYVGARDEVTIGSFTLKFKTLARSRPKASFGDSTRIVDRDLMREDQTEVVTADGLGDQAPRAEPPQSVYQPESRAAEYRPEPAQWAPPAAEVVSHRREEIAAALRDELDGGSYDVSDTARIDASPARARQAAAQQEETQIERAPEPPAPVAPDHGTRWLTPDPLSAPSLPLATEPSADFPADLGPSTGIPTVPQPFPPETVSEFLPAGMQPEPPIPMAELEAGEVAENEWGEEDDQRDFVEPFSLLNNLIREDFSTPVVATESHPVVEVIAYSSEKQLLRFDQVRGGQKLRIGPDRFVLVHFNDKSSCKVMFTDEFSGGVIAGGQTVSLDSLKSAANQSGKRKGRTVYATKLLKGDYANLIHEGGGSFLRFVNPPKMPPPERQFRIESRNLKIFGSAFLSHIVLLAIIGLLSPEQLASANEDLDRFAKVDIKDLQMEKPEEEVEVPLDQLPEPEQKEEEKKEEKVEETKPEEKPKPEKTKKTKVKASKDKGGGDGGDNAGAGMMAALGNLSKKENSMNIVTAVSNLDAVRVPGGKSRFKVSGLVTKLPTSDVVFSGSKGVGVKGGIELLRGGKGRGGVAGIGPGALGGGSIGARKVGGVVFKAPKRNMKVRGTLSREAIAKVVHQHLREIQQCYERNLLLNPKLSGKIVMEWTISTTGDVSVVKTQNNTMQTPAVAMCVSAQIKRWKFPKPQGGIVVVSYPFIFNSIGF